MAYLLANQNYKRNYSEKFANCNIESILTAHIESKLPNTMREIILILPTARLMRYDRSKIISRYSQEHGAPVEFLKVFSFRKFIRYIAERVWDIHVIAPSSGLTLFDEAVKEADLHFFRNAEEPDSTISTYMLKKLYSVICGLRKDGISSDTIPVIMKDYATSPKLQDLKEMMQKYEEKLGDDFCDEDGLLLRVNSLLTSSELLTEKLYDLFPYLRLLLFSNFSNFSKSENEFLNKLANSEMSVGIQIEFNDTTGPLLSGIETTILQLARNGFDIFEASSPDELSNKHINFLRMNLFAPKSHDRTPLFDSTIRIVECGNRLEEVKFIGRLIKKLKHDDPNLDLSEICVCYRTADRYAELFRNVFYQYNIPLNITDRLHLSVSSMAKSITTLLDIVINNYRYNDIAKFLTSGYLQHFNNDEKTISLTDLKKIYSECDLPDKGGFKTWTDKLSSRIEYLTSKINNANPSSKYIEKDKYSLENYKNLLSMLTSIHDTLPSNADVTIDEFGSIVQEALINRFKFYETIWANYKSLVAEKTDESYRLELIVRLELLEHESRAYYAISQLLEEFIRIHRLQNPDNKIKFSELVEKLKLAIDGTKYQIREKPGYGVTVTSIEQTRGIPYKVSILCGMLAKEFPLAYSNEAMFGLDDPEVERNHHINERLQYYFFLTNNPDALKAGKKQIFLTFPQQDNGRKLLRSSYIDYLLNIATPILPQLPSDNSEQYPIEKEIFHYALGESYNNDSFMTELAHTVVTTTEYIQQTNCSIEELPQSAMKEIGMASFDLQPDETNTHINEISEEELQPYSATALNEFIKCPLQYYYKRVLKLDDFENNKSGIPALEQGNILHDIFCQFYTSLAGTDDSEMLFNNPALPLIRLKKEKREQYLEKLKTLASEHFSEIEYYDSFYSKLDRDRIFGTGDHIGILEKWLDNELNLEDGFAASLFETQFTGYYENTGKKVTGKIDRIDLKYSKEDNELKILVADYKKSAEKLKLKVNNEIKDFQFPLYMSMAASEILPRFHLPKDIKITPEIGSYFQYGLKEEKYCIKQIAPDETSYDAIQPLATEKFNDIVKRISAGNFECKCEEKPDDSYSKCPYKQICPKFLK